MNDNNGQVVVVRYGRIWEVVPGTTRLYHVVEDKYYEWDGLKWVYFMERANVQKIKA